MRKKSGKVKQSRLQANTVCLQNVQRLIRKGDRSDGLFTMDNSDQIKLLLKLWNVLLCCFIMDWLVSFVINSLSLQVCVSSFSVH